MEESLASQGKKLLSSIKEELSLFFKDFSNTDRLTQLQNELFHWQQLGMTSVLFQRLLVDAHRSRQAVVNDINSLCTKIGHQRKKTMIQLLRRNEELSAKITEYKKRLKNIQKSHQCKHVYEI